MSAKLQLINIDIKMQSLQQTNKQTKVQFYSTRFLHLKANRKKLKKKKYGTD